MPELGILGRVDAVQDEMARFYALIGLTVSSAAQIEQCLFHCYRSASGLETGVAAKKFQGFSLMPKIKVADEAMTAAFLGAPEANEWSELINQVKSMLGYENTRNLVSHNALSAHVFTILNEDGTPDLSDGSAIKVMLGVSQNEGAIEIGRPEKMETYASLRKYAYELLSIETRLLDFQVRIFRRLGR